jgi:hypothetical protein
MHCKTKKGRKPRKLTIKKKIHHSKSRRIQHGGAIHLDLGGDRRAINGHHYNMIQTQIHEDGLPDFLYYGRAKVIYPASQPCHDGSQAPNPTVVADGKGTLINFTRDGSFSVYEGYFKDHAKHGRGKLSYFTTIPLGSELFRRFRTMDDLNDMTPDQYAQLNAQLSQHPPYAVYKGRFSNDAMSGFGKMTYANGDVYVGHWQNNMKSGRGQMRYNNGHVFRGTWHNDHPAPTVFGRVVNEAEPTPAIFTAVDQSNDSSGFDLSGFQSPHNIFRRP